MPEQCFGSIFGERSWIHTRKKWIRIWIQVKKMYLRFTEFFLQRNNFVFFFFLFYKSLSNKLKILQRWGHFYFFISSNSLESKIFCSLWLFALGSGSVHPHIYADPDQGSRNVADTTDSDPKHCKKPQLFHWKLFIWSLPR